MTCVGFQHGLCIVPQGLSVSEKKAVFGLLSNHTVRISSHIQKGNKYTVRLAANSGGVTAASVPACVCMSAFCLITIWMHMPHTLTSILASSQYHSELGWQPTEGSSKTRPQEASLPTVMPWPRVRASTGWATRRPWNLSTAVTSQFWS